MSTYSALKSLLTTCVLAALVSSIVESYKCTSCSLNACSADMETTCEASQSCFRYKQELRTKGELLQYVEEKGCSSSNCVPRMFSATLGDNQTFVYNHQCCQDELCNQGNFQVPQKSSKPNGIKCPACYNVHDISCDPVLLTCTGTETKCVEVIGIDNPIFLIFAMGCATETACNLKNISILNNIKIRTYCVEQSAGDPR
ncbi:protein RoBo-1-like [Panthera onca]|uniref:UPAR/Ly6 domain-containing protein n=2 Tax=Panthera TaxID=9688 RepID=A0A8C8XEJ2_PANLE|nr:protein RoBo-1-like [Panthera leo]XP_060490005.1 protein RoBo-1-like [Panthera onca]